MKLDNNSDKSSMAKFLIILKLLQQPYPNKNINKVLKNNSIIIDYKNNLGSEDNAKDKLNKKYILPLIEVTIEDEEESIINKNEITNNITEVAYETSENIDTTLFENLISEIPIIIAEKNIDIPVESTFRLKNAALDIKTMKKDVYLTNSKLIPMSSKNDISQCISGKLFLEGFIRNKLDFSIAKDVNDKIINLDTECFIIYIPFKYTTIIDYKVPPVFHKGKSLDYISIHISSDCVDNNSGYKSTVNDKNIDSSEYFKNDIPPIICEIGQTKIYETFTFLDKKPFSEDFPLEKDFHTIKENIIINLSLTLLQKQDIIINYKKDSI